MAGAAIATAAIANITENLLLLTPSLLDKPGLTATASSGRWTICRNGLNERK